MIFLKIIFCFLEYDADDEIDEYTIPTFPRYPTPSEIANEDVFSISRAGEACRNRLQNLLNEKEDKLKRLEMEREILLELLKS